MKKLLPSLLFIFCFFLSHAQWVERNSGLVGGNVRCFATLGTTLFAGTDGGVFKSTDNGATWSASSNGIKIPFVSSLAVVGNDLFAGTRLGIFRSSDNGLNWIEPNPEFPAPIKTLVTVGETLFAGFDGGVYRSNNRGVTWNQMINGITGDYVTALTKMGTELLVAVSHSLYRSSNNAESWVKVGNGLPENAEFQFLASKGEDYFAVIVAIDGSSSQMYKGSVYKSSDHGDSWILASTGLPQDVFQTLAVKNDNLFLGGDKGVYLSTNNGASWIGVNNSLSNTQVFSFGVAGSNLLLGSNRGVFSTTTNGNSWSSSNTGLGSVSVSSIVKKGADLFVGATGQGVFISTDNGASWSERNIGLTDTNVNTLIAVDNDLYASSEYGGVFYSANNGTSWTSANNGLSNTRIFALASSGNKIFAGTSNGVYLSTNVGQNWLRVNATEAFDYVWSLEYINGILFAGCSKGVFLSHDNGETWAESGLLKYIYSIKSIGSDIFAAGNGGVYGSSDNGVTWTNLNEGLPEDPNYKLEPFTDKINMNKLATVANNLFAGYYGVYFSTDLGKNWAPINNGLPTTFFANSFYTTENSLLAGSYGRGVWELLLTNAPLLSPVAAAASSINSTGFTANWAVASGATSYQLDVSKDNFATFVEGYNSKTVTGTSQAVTGLTSTTTYQYRVRAVNELGISGNSASISATTLMPPPTAPTALAATAISSTGFTANWAAVMSSTGYQLDISKDNFATFVEGYNSKPIIDTSQVVIGLTSSTSFQYRVRAVNDGGVSGNSANVSVTTLIPPPSTPTSLAATAIFSTGFTANWAAVSSASGYQLDISKDNFATFVEGYNSKPITGTSQAVTGLTSATPYQYRVRAVNDGGVSGSAASVSVTTLVPPPSSPTSLAATAISSTGFTANWAAASGATVYQLDISKDNFATFVEGYNSKPVGGTSQTVTGLVPVTVYQYRVRAVNEVGVSANSASVSVTTGVVITGDLNSAATTTAVYPNPFADYIEIENKTGQIMEIVLYDVTGRRSVLPFEDRGEVLRVPTDTIPAGVYLLSVQEGTSVKTAKMVKR